MSAECAICYVTDQGFLLPSLASAARVRSFVSRDAAEIFVFTIGVDEQIAASANKLLNPRGIRVVALAQALFDRIDQERLAKTYTPLGTFGRFFMEQALPESYSRIVYLDGDVWAVRDPSQLIDTPVPEGRFAAADDILFYRSNLGFGYTAKTARAYFGALGLTPQMGYFNAGVFAVSRPTWKKIAAEAYEYFLDHLDTCVRFDQSALNAVVGPRRLRLSAKWNFQTQLKVWGVNRYVEPVLYHCNLPPKPWQGRISPWEEMFDVFQTAFSELSPIGLPNPLLSQEETDRANARFAQMYSYLRWPLATDAALLVMRFRQIEKSKWI